MNKIPKYQQVLIQKAMLKISEFVDQEVAAGRIEKDSVASALLTLGSRMCGASSTSKRMFLDHAQKEFETGRKVMRETEGADPEDRD